MLEGSGKNGSVGTGGGLTFLGAKHWSLTRFILYLVPADRQQHGAKDDNKHRSTEDLEIYRPIMKIHHAKITHHLVSPSDTVSWYINVCDVVVVVVNVVVVSLIER
jgi:hypothetical protein